MKIKATVILDVEDVQTYEEAYHAVFSFPGHCMSAWDKNRKYCSAYFRKILTVEGLDEKS